MPDEARVLLGLAPAERIYPFALSNGAARRCYERMSADVRLRAWLPEAAFAALGSCTSAEEFTKIAERIFTDTGSAPGA